MDGLRTPEVDPAGGRAWIEVDESVYPLDAVYGAAYLFVDRCFVWLDRLGPLRVRVELKARGGADAAALQGLVGEFGNELLNQTLRSRLAETHGRLREYVMAKAFFSADPQSTLDRLLAELDAEELDQDPLEIPVPWESKP